MGALSIWHIILVLIMGLLYVLPIALILGRAGFSRWWGLIFFVPIANFIALWAFAFIKWPRDAQ